MEARMKAQTDDALLTPAEVAALFRVDPKTVTRWAKAGKLSSIRTLGGHRRYRADEVKKFLEGAKQQLGWVGFESGTGLTTFRLENGRFGVRFRVQGFVARGRIELPTPRFSVACSTN
jgi:excisionase family DNA binding protein